MTPQPHRRRASEPEDFITPILCRVMDRHPEVKQRDLARALGCDESRISHIRAGRQRLAAHEVNVFCDVYDTMEPLDAMADRMNHELVERVRRSTTLTAAQTHLANLMRDIGRAVVAFSEGDYETVDHLLQAVTEEARATRARLPLEAVA